MSRKTILIITITIAILLITSIANIILSFRASALLTKTKADFEKVENDLIVTGDELKEYKYLLNNLNSISLKTIYYGVAGNESSGSEHFFTAFSLFYKEELIL